MLRRKASFVLGTKSILCLFLAFAFYEKASAAAHREFGCLFADSQYRMQRTYNKERPVYGNISSLVPISFPTQKSEIVEPLQRKLFSEPNIMNDVSLFTKFVQDLKNSPTRNTLESFFNNYEIPFKPKEYYVARTRNGTRKTHDPASYLIQEFHTLKAHLALTQKSVSPYLVTAYVDPIGIDFPAGAEFNNAQMNEKMPILLQKRVQDHVAGIIKVQAGGRKGYILMDPGYANGAKLYHPFIVYVMEDRQPPHGEFISNPMNNANLVITTGVGRAGSYILVKHTRAKSTKYVLYYVHMAYCSFMENTVKSNLIRFNHGIVARNTNGTKPAYLRFKISSKDKASFPKSMQKAFDLPDHQMTAIKNEIKYIKSNVIENAQIMSDLNNLANKLDLDVEQRRKYREPVEPQRSRSNKMKKLLGGAAKAFKDWYNEEEDYREEDYELLRL